MHSIVRRGTTSGTTLKVLAASTALMLVTGCSSMWPFGGSEKQEKAALYKSANAAATTQATPANARGERVLWTASGQFVKIVPVDVSGTTNTHPTKLTGDQVRRALTQLQVKEDEESEAGEAFTPEEIGLLATQLPKAFAQAGPGEDVVTATIGYRTSKLFIKDQKITTIRLFYNEAGLNMIFGQVHDSARETDNLLKKQDEREHPYIPGKRTEAVSHVWTVSATNPAITPAQTGRDDWFVFKPESLTGAPPVPNTVTAPPPYYGQQGQPYPYYGQPPAGVIPPAAAKPVDERLKALEDLRQRGLITDEEAKEKRRQILEAL